MCDILVRITQEAGVLTAVNYFYRAELPKEVVGIRLTFTEGSWIITVNEEDDSINLQELANVELSEVQSVDASTYFPWAAALNKGIRWIWTLKNQQNYLDGLQFEFSDPDRGGTVTIQLMAVASRLDISSVLVAETPT